MGEKTVVIVTQEDDGRFSAFSPELPGFAYGADTESEFKLGLIPAVTWAGGKPDLDIYLQRPLETPEGVEYYVRIRQDNRPERAEVARRLQAMIGTAQRFQFFGNAHALPTSEYVILCSLPDDPLQSVLDTVASKNDAIIVALAVADGMLWVQEIMTGPREGVDLVPLAALGLPQHATVRDLMLANDPTSLGTDKPPILVGV